TRLQGDWSSDVCSSDLRALDVLALEALPRCRSAGEHSLSGTETLAYDAGIDLRVGCGDVGVQRNAVDGPISDADRRSGRRSSRRSEERRVGKEGRAWGV